eukprot:Plantae.Rhodophyta-Hildenbrandia_rubra.ctg6022.p1 GENE.Plantae.Rhodophyta-Hildenbrandia_rubra.ctg6022~~Plantae.Rhodophyta-Hildenbrandia_rubra.ctg6022.p1  ORF type:complete len:525 (+),score=60.11 Plantae.Rhodophyta-Hildenbrandia_rubra.ctg6022:3325-4899(+)
MVKLLLEHGAQIKAPALGEATPIYIAAESDNMEALTMMLEWGWNIDSRDDEGCTPLIEASCRNDVAVFLQLLIKRGADVGSRNTHQENAAHYAAWDGLRVKLQNLLVAGCPIDAQSCDGSTPLHFAATQGWTAIVADLSMFGANLDISDINGNTPLLLATERGYRNVVATLLGSGASVNIKNKRGSSAVHIAAMRDDIKTIRLLLRYGSDVIQEDRWGWTALNWVIESDRAQERCSLLLKVADLLLNQGAPIDSLCRSPMHDDELWDNATLTCLLLDQGAPIDAKIFGYSPLQSLLERECDLHMTRRDEWTALHWSVSERSIESMNTVLKRGISIDDPGTHGLNPLCIAAMDGYADVMGILIEGGAYIRYVDESGRSALIHASRNGQQAAVGVLLARDAGIDLDLGKEKSPLIIAARNGHKDVIDTIMESIDDSHYEYRERELNLAWHVAQRNEHEDVANMLASYLKSGNVIEKCHGIYYDSENSFADWDSSPGEIFFETILDEDKDSGTYEEDGGTAVKLICW